MRRYCICKTTGCNKKETVREWERVLEIKNFSCQNLKINKRVKDKKFPREVKQRNKEQ